MKFKWLIIYVVCLLCLSQYSFSQGVESKIDSLFVDVKVKKIPIPDGYRSAFEINIKQPLDHGDTNAGFFYQKLYLSHMGYTNPTVIVTEGYNKSINEISEPASLLNANQILVEHRFFGESAPDSLDYRQLNMKQVTADLHQIAKLFKSIYTGKWISTGVSKGGQTTIYYRYFYPEDVDVSIPYVAPLNLEYKDERIYHFFDTVGTENCRKKIKSYQLNLLENRNAILHLIKKISKKEDYTYDYLTVEGAFEYSVLEFPFSFWQWGYDCESVPGEEATNKELFNYLMRVVDVEFFSDLEINEFASHYYQAANELGYYGYETSEFKGMLKYLSDSINPSAIFPPAKMHVDYDNTLSYQVYNWIKEQGNNFIYIYGGIDTWSATAVRPSDKTNSVWFFLKNKAHHSANISNMNDSEKELLINTLEEWLQLKTDIKDIP